MINDTRWTMVAIKPTVISHFSLIYLFQVSNETEIEQQSVTEVAAAATADSQQASSDPPHPVSSKSVQTEQSAEVDEQKLLNWLLMTREKDLKQYIELLQQELEKRCNEAVVSAAKWREVEAQLTEIHSSDTTDLPTSSAPPWQQEKEEP